MSTVHGVTTPVTTTYGPIYGTCRVSSLGTEYVCFQSIPYAQPPVGELRFKDPQPPKPWTEPLDATRPPLASLYVDSTGVVSPKSSEDCLVLNVYTKQVSTSANYPVMVWIHGGAFKTGSSSDHFYAPDFLLQKDVIVVTINYRLGALGFASFDDPSLNIPGNAGLKDQTLALRWVRANIAQFGGDPHNVTLFGNSAGGCSVHLHMLSDHSRNLFDKAISQSGTALSDWANYPKNDWTRRLAVKMGWNGVGGDTEVYAFLRDADAADIILHQEKVVSMNERMDAISAFGPAVEAYVAEQSFFTVDPHELAKGDVWGHRVPFIIGGCADEGLLFYKILEKGAEYFQSEAGIERAVPLDLGFPRGSEKSKAVSKKVQKQYYGDELPTINNYLTTLKIWADKVFWHGIYKSVLARVKSGQRAPTFVYRFGVDSEKFAWSKLKTVGKYVTGTSHTDDVYYLFKSFNMVEPIPQDSMEWKTIQRMVGLWTQFATTGNPNESTELNGISWSPVDESTVPLYGLHIEDDLHVAELPENERSLFWENIFAENR